MKKHGLTELFIFIVTAELTGVLSSLVSGGYGDYRTVNKPPLSPPGWVFPVVWTVLYALIGASAYLVWSADAPELKKQNALRVYYFQMILNFLWSIIFFRFGLYTAAAAELILLIAAVTVMTVKFFGIRPLAGYLNLPYIAWLLFALYLNIGTALLN